MCNKIQLLGKIGAIKLIFQNNILYMIIGLKSNI
jgi:hypothetical protein